MMCKSLSKLWNLISYCFLVTAQPNKVGVKTRGVGFCWPILFHPNQNKYEWEDIPPPKISNKPTLTNRSQQKRAIHSGTTTPIFFFTSTSVSHSLTRQMVFYLMGTFHGEYFMLQNGTLCNIKRDSCRPCMSYTFIVTYNTKKKN